MPSCAPAVVRSVRPHRQRLRGRDRHRHPTQDRSQRDARNAPGHRQRTHIPAPDSKCSAQGNFADGEIIARPGKPKQESEREKTNQGRPVWKGMSRSGRAVEARRGPFWARHGPARSWRGGRAAFVEQRRRKKHGNQTRNTSRTTRRPARHPAHPAGRCRSLCARRNPAHFQPGVGEGAPRAAAAARLSEQSRPAPRT